MALTAAHCTKTLITASASGSVLLRQCTKTLLPGMVEYVAKVAGMAGEEAALQSHLPAVGEIIKAFGTLFTTIPEDLRESLCMSSGPPFFIYAGCRRRPRVWGFAPHLDAAT